MIKASELRIGNWIVWNPRLTSPTTTLIPFQVEVTSIRANKIGYISPRVEHRAEPFEDDLLHLETPLKPLEEFEPILLTADLLERCGFTKEPSDHRYTCHGKVPLCISLRNDKSIMVKLDNHELNYYFFHQLQNLYYTLTGEELDLS